MEGSRFTRRQAIAGAGALGLGALAVAGCGGGDDGGSRSAPTGSTTTAGSAESPSCVLSPEQTEGPYYIDDHLLRRDVTEGRPGVPLELRLTVQDATECSAVKGATVEIWHADASGVYSGFDSGEGETFLRGGQRTDAKGVATLKTIYPGWYQGRTTHIHVKVHAGGNVVDTGQLYFDDATSDAVYRRQPYAAHGARDMTNEQDGIYAQGGKESTLALARAGGGYVGRLALGVRT
jgi:protocatechuate 3,4-dioxygenase beta subunit